MPQITILPYSEKHKKPTYRKVKFQKENKPPFNIEDKILNRLDSLSKLNKLDKITVKSRNIFTPSDYNTIGRVWTF